MSGSQVNLKSIVKHCSQASLEELCLGAINHVRRYATAGGPVSPPQPHLSIVKHYPVTPGCSLRLETV